MTQTGFTTQLLAASLRHPNHVLEAALAGADIGLERFLADWKRTQPCRSGPRPDAQARYDNCRVEDPTYAPIEVKTRTEWSSS